MDLNLRTAIEDYGSASTEGGSPASNQVLDGQQRGAFDALLGLVKVSPLSDNTTPPLTPPRTATPRAASLAARQAQDRDIFSSVRRQMQVLEDRLSNQISRAQQQNERSRDSALARMEAKISTMELLQPKVDRRLAELHGNMKALSEENQVQIRRLDQIDSRFWEWRHKMDEEMRGKFAQSEQSIQEVASSIRVAKAANEEASKKHHERLLHMEQRVDERGVRDEDFSNTLMDMHSRLLEIEHDATATSPGVQRNLEEKFPDASATSTGVCQLEAQLQGLTQKMAQLQEESYDLRMRLESQEEHHKASRVQLEAKDSQIRELENRMVHENWEGRVKELQRSLDESMQGSRGHAEQVEILLRRFQSHEETQAELKGHIRRLQERQTGCGGESFGDASTPRGRALVGLSGANDGVVRERLDAIEGDLRELQSKAPVAGANDGVARERLDAIEGDLRQLQSKAEDQVQGRIAEVLESLREFGPKMQELSPKVLANSRTIGDLALKVEAIEQELLMENTQARRERISTMKASPEIVGHQQAVGDLENKVQALEQELHSVSTGLFTPLNARIDEFVIVQVKFSEEINARLAKLEASTNPTDKAELQSVMELQAVVDHLSTRIVQLEAEVTADTGPQAEVHTLLARVERLESEVHGEMGSEDSESDDEEASEQPGEQHSEQAARETDGVLSNALPAWTSATEEAYSPTGGEPAALPQAAASHEAADGGLHEAVVGGPQTS